MKRFKKALAILSSVLMISACAVSPIYADYVVDIAFVPFKDIKDIAGDVNGDYELTVRDCAEIASQLASGKTLGMSADYNQDGKGDIRDAAAIAKLIASVK